MADAIDVSEWQDTATQYASELKMLPYLSLGKTLEHMSPRPGIQFNAVMGSIASDAELILHDGTKRLQNGPTTTKREIITRVGDLIIEEDPEALRKTIWGRKLIGNNSNLEEHPMKFLIMALIMRRVGDRLARCIFSANYDAAAFVTTNTLFDGFDTITSDEITANKITLALGNYNEIDTITNLNAWDVLREADKNCEDELRDVDRKMYISRTIYDNYCESYKNEFGSAAYNKEFKKVFLEGTDNMCELVPLIGKKDSEFIHVTTQDNMGVGFDAMSDLQNIMVRLADNPWKLQFAFKANFGTQFESIHKTKFKAFKMV